MHALICCYNVIDIDECTDGIHFCAHNCFNTIGSYSCICEIGYLLNEDGRQCDGIFFHRFLLNK